MLRYIDGTWTTDAETLTAPTPVQSSQFGYSVAISDDGSTIATVSYMDTTYVSQGGLLHIFKRIDGVWTYYQKLFSKGIIGNYIASVAISGNGKNIAIGPSATSGEHVFLYRETSEGWKEIKLIMSSDWVTGHNFGKAMAFDSDGTRLMISAPYANGNKGKCYFFS